MAEPPNTTTERPIFPLGTVLVPGMMIPLKIFEDRYKRMLADCERDETDFGINLIRSGREVGESAEPFEIGTVAVIRERRALPDGTTILLVTGGDRYRLVEVIQQEPYVRARVTTIKDADAGRISDQDPDFRALSRRAHELASIGREEDDPEIELPGDPGELSWHLTARLPIDNDTRQGLLEMTSLADRLRRLLSMMDDAIRETRRQAKLQERVQRIRQTNGKLSASSG